MVFRVLLIAAAGVALVAIVIHYNNVMSAPAPVRLEGFETADVQPQSTMMPASANVPPAMDQPPGAPMGAEEDMLDLPAPVDHQVSSGAINDQLKPSDLLPRIGNSPEEKKFAQLYSTGQGDMQGINFLDAGSQVGLSTRYHKNANLQLRSDPPILKQPLPFSYSTIESDRLRLPLEIGSRSSSVPAAGAY